MSDQTIQISREELYEQVWSEPMITLAKRFGLSDVGLAKVCRKLNVPRPERGYWVKKKHSKPVVTPPLPPLKDGEQSVAILVKRETPYTEGCESTVADMKIAFEKRGENHIRVPEMLDVVLHPLVAQAQKSLKGVRPGDRGLLQPRAKNCLDIQVGANSVARALRIMDALLKALDDRELPVTVKPDEKGSTTVSVLGETLAFGLEESVSRKEREPTPAERKKSERDPWYSFTFKQYDFIPTVMLSLRIKDLLWVRDVRCTWSDGKVQRLENCLNVFIVGLIRAAVAKQAERQRREKQEREWEEQRRRREERAARYQEEKARLERLERDAEAWHKSQMIRTYVKAVREDALKKQGSIAPGSELDQWLAWANQQADRFDPLVESPPSVLDEDDYSGLW
jgi:hypothetical protein